LAERAPEKREVTGSTPVPATKQPDPQQPQPVVRDGRSRRAGRWFLAEEPPHLTRVEAAVAAEGPDRGDLSRLVPPGHRLGIDAEHLRDLGRGEQLVVLIRLITRLIAWAIGRVRARGVHG
jgi:hypothetical protein